MAFETNIAWTEATWNPWHGCHKVSDGCKHCYMYRDKERFKQDPTIVVRSKTTFLKPLSWTDPRLIFPCSWSDFFVKEADAWRAEAWEIIKATPWHTYQILTKRIERAGDCLPADWGSGYKNVWLGTSIESDKYNNRIDYLLKIPAIVRWISAEPLLYYLNLGFINKEVRDGIHWVVVGGESGNETGKYLYRPCEIKWIESIVKQCKKNDIPVFVKQMGTFLANSLHLSDRHGKILNEFPTHLQIQQFPKIRAA